MFAVKGTTAQPVPRYNANRIPTAVLDSSGRPASIRPRPGETEDIGKFNINSAYHI